MGSRRERSVATTSGGGQRPAQGLQIAPPERRVRCLPPAYPLPAAGGPYGAARRARRASPSSTPYSLQRTVLSSALRNWRKRLTKQAAFAACGAARGTPSPPATAPLGLPCSGCGAVAPRLEEGEACRRARARSEAVQISRAGAVRSPADRSRRPRTPRGPATSVRSMAPSTPPRTGVSRCGATARPPFGYGWRGRRSRRHPFIASLSREYLPVSRAVYRVRTRWNTSRAHRRRP